MILVLLKFSDNKALAPQHMPGHKLWIQQGIEEKVFVLVGSLQPNQGGAVLMHGLSREQAEKRVSLDPFVEHQVVTPEYVEISPSASIEKLSFLLSSSKQ